MIWLGLTFVVLFGTVFGILFVSGAFGPKGEPTEEEIREFDEYIRERRRRRSLL